MIIHGNTSENHCGLGYSTPYDTTEKHNTSAPFDNLRYKERTTPVQKNIELFH